MKAWWWLWALALAGCSRPLEIGGRPSAVAATTTTAMERPDGTVGQTHRPYAGKPKYLAAARPLYLTAPPTAGAATDCLTRTPVCDQRLRAVLAAVDGQLLLLETPPTRGELEATRLTLLELTPLLTPYPDLASEREELARLLEQLPTLSVAEQQRAHQRLAELSDLLRVQLAAAQ